MAIGGLRGILPLLAAVFIDVFSFGLMYPVLVGYFQQPEVLAEYGPGRANLYLSLAFSLFPLGMIFGASLLGDLSDSLGRKRTLLLCLTGLGAAYALMWLGIATLALEWLLLGRLLSGLMAGTGPIAQAAMVEGGSEAETGRNLAKVVLVNCIALVVGPAAGGLLAHLQHGAPLAFALLLCLLAFTWLARGYREPPRQRRALQLSWSRPVTLFAKAFRHPRISRVALAFFLFQFGFALYYIYVMLRLTGAYGLSTAALGLFSATLGVGFALGSTAGYRLALKLCGDDRRTALCSALACGLPILLSALPLPVALQWVLGLVIATANSPLFVALLALISGSAGENEKGWALGIGTAMMALAFFLSGALAVALQLLPLWLLIAAGGLLVLAAALPVLRFRPALQPA